ncbi:hypothetical protein Tco_0119548, partial [Tanacetum coccineum]
MGTPTLCDLLERMGTPTQYMCDLLEQIGTPTQVCVWSCPNFSALAGRPFRALLSTVEILAQLLGLRSGNGYSEKGEKRSKTDKTKHEMEKREKVKVNPKSQQVKAEDETKEILMDQPA